MSYMIDALGFKVNGQNYYVLASYYPETKTISIPAEDDWEVGDYVYSLALAERVIFIKVDKRVDIKDCKYFVIEAIYDNSCEKYTITLSDSIIEYNDEVGKDFGINKDEFELIIKNYKLYKGKIEYEAKM